MSLPLQLLLTEQLGSMEETQRLVFNLLIQQSGSECHLDQTSLSQRRHVTIIIVFCIIRHSDFSSVDQFKWTEVDNPYVFQLQTIY